MQIKETVKKLYLMEIRKNGISHSDYDKLNNEEQALLEKKYGAFFLKTENRKLITVAMTGGAFDILHPGHVYTLAEAKKHGDVLVVSVARDEYVTKRKGRLINQQSVRVAMVEQLKPVDIALAGVEDPVKTLESVNPDVIVYGYDQNPFVKPEGVKIIKLKKAKEPEKHKTSKIIDSFLRT